MSPDPTVDRGASRGGILLIDDDVDIHHLVGHHLAGLDCLFRCVANPREGLEVAAAMRPDVVLLDLKMPEIDGFEVCRRLASNTSTSDCMIVFLTSHDAPETISKGLELGASDYLTKPFNAVELRARVRVALRTKRLIDILRQETRVDSLTGLRNRRFFDESLSATVAVRERKGVAFSLLLLDLDHFKRVNDEYGHGVGDDVLRAVGDMMRRTVRPYDVACRYGGEEFAVVANDTDREGANVLGDRLLQDIGAIRVRAGDALLDIDCSIGIVCSDDCDPALNASQICALADSALYRAKREGRGRVCYFDPSIDEGISWFIV